MYFCDLCIMVSAGHQARLEAVACMALFGVVLDSERGNAHWSSLFPDARVAAPLDLLSAP
jgi:hypothetical protein